MNPSGRLAFALLITLGVSAVHAQSSNGGPAMPQIQASAAGHAISAGTRSVPDGAKAAGTHHGAANASFDADWDGIAHGVAGGPGSYVPFASLPLSLAIKTVKGNGARKIAVFSDPLCPFCHRLEASLVPVTNVTIYSFLLPLEQSDRQAAQIWCSPDRSAALAAWMLKHRTPPGKADCPTPIARIKKLAAQLHIQVTPTIIFANGQVVPGALSTQDLERMLSASGKS
jgi:thiol:disulfide interchange protein DsbC